MGTHGSTPSSWAQPLAARSTAEGTASRAGLQQALHRRQVCRYLQGQKFQQNHLYDHPLPLKTAMTTQLSPSCFPSHIVEGQTSSPMSEHSPVQPPHPGAYLLQVTQPQIWGHSPAAHHAPGLLGTLTGLTANPGKAPLLQLGRSTSSSQSTALQQGHLWAGSPSSSQRLARTKEEYLQSAVLGFIWALSSCSSR